MSVSYRHASKRHRPIEAALEQFRAERAATWRARRDRLPHGIAVGVVITFLAPGAWTTSAGYLAKLATRLPPASPACRRHRRHSPSRCQRARRWRLDQLLDLTDVHRQAASPPARQRQLRGAARTGLGLRVEKANTAKESFGPTAAPAPESKIVFVEPQMVTRCATRRAEPSSGASVVGGPQ